MIWPIWAIPFLCVALCCGWWVVVGVGGSVVLCYVFSTCSLLFCVLLCVVVCLAVRAGVGGEFVGLDHPTRDTPPLDTPPPDTSSTGHPLRRTAQNFALFSLPHPFSFFLSLTVCLLVEFWCLNHRDPQMCTFGLSGCLGAAGASHHNPRTPKVHIRRPQRFQTPPRNHEKTPERQREKKNENGGGRRKKKHEILGPRPSAPPFGVAPPFGAQFFWVWAPPFGATTHTQIQMDWPKFAGPKPRWSKLDWPKLVKSGWPKRDCPKSVSSPEEIRYPELLGQFGRSRLVVFAEIGGWWSGETLDFFRQLAKARVRGAFPNDKSRLRGCCDGVIMACSAAALSLKE